MARTCLRCEGYGRLTVLHTPCHICDAYAKLPDKYDGWDTCKVCRGRGATLNLAQAPRELGREFDCRKCRGLGLRRPQVESERGLSSQPQTAKQEQGSSNAAQGQHEATLLEKTTCLVVGAVIVGLVCWVVIRNEPFADSNIVVVLRTLLSLSTAVLGFTVPGFLHVEMRGRGFVIRAGGALALFVLTFFFTPRVLPITEKTNVDAKSSANSMRAGAPSFALGEGWGTDTMSDRLGGCRVSFVDTMSPITFIS